MHKFSENIMTIKHTCVKIEKKGEIKNMSLRKIYKLSPTETMVMEFLWANNYSVKTYEILDYFVQNKGKTWKRQTLNTLLIRLDDKGVIERKRGFVEAKYTYEELLHIACKDFVDTKFNGKISNVIKAYYMNEKIPEKEAEELINTIQPLI